MLNYVWLALIFLGIGAALSTDISNQAENKFRNNDALKVQITSTVPIHENEEKVYDVNLRITSKEFSSFYKEDVKNDISIPAKLSINPKEKKSSLFLKIGGNSPNIWKEMAKVSGREDDLTGSVQVKDLMNDTTAAAFVVFEKISFVKMKDITNAALNYASTAVEIALGLIGIMALWLGVMKIAEEAGLIQSIAKALKPVTRKLFPDVPTDHPAMGSMIMNISANMLGLGNAATPFGLKAMEELDELNPSKGTATNAMCTFLAINTAGMTLIPASAIAIRAASGSTDPTVIIGTSLFGAACATIVGISSAKILEKFPIKAGGFTSWLKENSRLIITFTFILLALALIIFSGLGRFLSPAVGFIDPEFIKSLIQIFSIVAIPFLIFAFIGYGVIKKVKIYEQFVEGAKDGFNIAVRIIPYLVAMLMAIGIFRAGGAMDWLIFILKPFTDFIGMPAEALPMALMRPLSGSGSLGIMAEIMTVHGPDSFLGILVSTFYGSTETTFYVLAVYFGSVNVKKTRHALPAGLLADIAGILGAVFIVKLLFG